MPRDCIFFEDLIKSMVFAVCLWAFLCLGIEGISWFFSLIARWIAVADCLFCFEQCHGCTPPQEEEEEEEIDEEEMDEEEIDEEPEVWILHTNCMIPVFCYSTTCIQN